MRVSPVSFMGWGRKATQADHNIVDKVAKIYGSGSQEDEKIVKLTHDVFQIVPWACSEGETIEQEDRAISDAFMKVMREDLKNGNSQLAYAMGRLVVLKSPAGRANNSDFDHDLPLGDIKNLGQSLYEHSKVYNYETKSYEQRPEFAEVEKVVWEHI